MNETPDIWVNSFPVKSFLTYTFIGFCGDWNLTDYTTSFDTTMKLSEVFVYPLHVFDVFRRSVPSMLLFTYSITDDTPS